MAPGLFAEVWRGSVEFSVGGSSRPFGGCDARLSSAGWRAVWPFVREAEGGGAAACLFGRRCGKLRGRTGTTGLDGARWAVGRAGLPPTPLTGFMVASEGRERYRRYYQRRKTGGREGGKSEAGRGRWESQCRGGAVRGKLRSSEQRQPDHLAKSRNLTCATRSLALWLRRVISRRHTIAATARGSYHQIAAESGGRQEGLAGGRERSAQVEVVLTPAMRALRGASSRKERSRRHRTRTMMPKF